MTKEESQQWIGRQVEAMRKQKGMSQTELAELTGLTRTHIWRIETGKYNVGFYQVQAIAQVLGYKIEFKQTKNR